MTERGRLLLELLPEVQERIDGFERDLLALDAAVQSGREAPDVVDALFRNLHTVRGLAGTGGAADIEAVAFELESVLSKLRLGQIEPTGELIGALFESAEMLPKLLAAARDGRSAPRQVLEALLASLRRLRGEEPAPAPKPPEVQIPAELAEILTEFEEHRLRECLREGRALVRLQSVFSFETIEQELAELKAVVRPLGEIVTTLPEGSTTDPSLLGLDFLFASRVPLEELSRALSDRRVQIAEVAWGGAPEPAEAPADGALARVPAEAAEEASGEARSPGIVPDARWSVAPPPPGGRAEMDALAVQTVRVDIQKLDRLMNIVGELGIVRTQLATMIERLRAVAADRGVTVDLHRLERTFERQLDAMQQGVLEVRMVPLAHVFQSVAVEVRKVSRDLGKAVNLVVTGAETEVDKLVGEALTAPFAHLVRNAIDHGLEPADERAAAGKLPSGTLALNAFQKGRHVVIQLEDDGRGIDAERLVEKAIERGLLTPEDAAALAPRDVLHLIFVPGLSTRSVVTATSGRGVGMDVVKTDVAKVGGSIEIHTERGVGTRFTITIPITLAIINALMVRCADRLFAIPMSSVEEAVALDLSVVRQVDQREMVTLRGATLPLCFLDRLFELPAAEGVPELAEGGLNLTQYLPAAPGRRSQRRFIVVASAGAQRLGLVVESLVGEQDIVIKALGPSLSGVRGFSGATELGDQRIALVLDVQALIEEARAGGASPWGAPGRTRAG